MDPFNQEQLSLQQQFQQQRIMELHAVQRRQMEMQAQVTNRFTQLQDRALAITSPRAMPPLMSQVGLGRNTTAPGGDGIARQSLLGALLDSKSQNPNAWQNSGFLSPFFKRVGFQFSATREDVALRAQEELAVFRENSLTVMGHAILPDFAARALGRVGMDQIQKNSFLISDAFQSVRGESSDGVGGRGIGRRRSGRIMREFTKDLNEKYDSALSSDQITQLTDVAMQSLTPRDLSRMARGSDKDFTGELNKIVDSLKKIAENSGISVEKLGKIQQESLAMGNDLADLDRVSNFVSGVNTTNGATRQRQLRVGISLTAQGRQMNMASAGGFAEDQMGAINDLVSLHTLGLVNNAELMRYGGGDKYEGAMRVQQQRLQSGNKFAQENVGTLGVLGNNVFNSQKGGYLGTMQDISATYARDPYAGLNNRFNYSNSQLLVSNSDQLMLKQAENIVDMMPVPESARLGMTKSIFGEMSGRNDLDASREVDMLYKGEEVVDRSLNRFKENLSKESSDQFEKNVVPLIKTKVLPLLRQRGVALDDIFSDDSLFQLRRSYKDGQEFVPSEYLMERAKHSLANTREQIRSIFESDDLSSLRESMDKKQFREVWALSLLPSWGSGDGHGGGGMGYRYVPEHTSKAQASFFEQQLGKGKYIKNLMNMAKTDLDQLASDINAFDLEDGHRDFYDKQEILEKLQTQKGTEDVYSRMTEDQRAHFTQKVQRQYLTNRVNMDTEAKVTDGSYNKPFYVKMRLGGGD